MLGRTPRVNGYRPGKPPSAALPYKGRSSMPEVVAKLARRSGARSRLFAYGPPSQAERQASSIGSRASELRALESPSSGARVGAEASLALGFDGREARSDSASSVLSWLMRAFGGVETGGARSGRQDRRRATLASRGSGASGGRAREF